MNKQANETYFTGINLIILTIVISLATFMEVLDTTIVNVSIPSIAGSLGSTNSQATWTISFYTLASAIVVPLTDWFTKRLGQVKVFISSILLFTFMSFLCSLAKSIDSLAIFRFLQGFFSGPMVPLSQVLLISNYPKNKRALGQAFFVMTIMLGPIFGPLLGGYITDNLNWKWLFYINIPVGILSSFICWIFLRKKESKIIKIPIDYVGIILLILGVGSLQLLLDNGNDKDWFNSNFICILSIIAFIGITLFIIWETTHKKPIVDLSILKNRNFLVSILCIFFGMFCFFGGMIVAPLWLQTAKGYTAFWSGLSSSPVGILSFFLFPVIGLYMNKINLRLLVSFSFIIFSITMFWFGSFNLDTSFKDLILVRLIQGIGIACFFLPLNQIALSSIVEEKLVSASGLINFFRALSTSFSTAIIVFVWNHYSIINYANLSENVNLSKDSTNNYLNSLSSLNITNTSTYSYVSDIISKQAYTLSTNFVFNLMGIIFLFLIFIVWLSKPNSFGVINNKK